MKRLLPVLLVAFGCSGVPEDLVAPRVAPLELVASDPRVVLTPGGRATVRIQVRREEPDPAHPVQLELGLLGDGGDVTATLSTDNTKADLVTLTLVAGATARDVDFRVRGQLGPYQAEATITASVRIPQPVVEGDVEQYAPGVTGVMKQVVVDGVPLTIEVIDGLAILDGDIVLGDAATLEARSMLFSATCHPDFRSDFFCSRFTDGVVNYTFADDWGSVAANSMMRVRVESAIAHWEEHTGIRFVRSGVGEHIEFRNGDGCFSTVGRAIITGLDDQSITISTGCGRGSIIHEIGHAIGLWHEQSRSDRGAFVDINPEFIQDDRESQFAMKGDALANVGAYDYGSIMHYGRGAFAIAGADCAAPDYRECPLAPTNPPDAVLGQRDALSEGDLLGVYTLYPPSFAITGAVTGQTADRFFLRAVFSTASPRADRIVWTSNLVGAPLGTGHTLDLRANMVPAGPNVITAAVLVAGETVASRSIILDVRNAAPVAMLAISDGLQQDMNHFFTVSATVSDPEEPTCASCTFRWDPAPSAGPADQPIAQFRFSAPGPQTITLTVVDRAGGVGTGSIVVEIVNTPPQVTILRPSTHVVVPDGTELPLEASATDINGIACIQLSWASSVAADIFLPALGCTPRVALIGPGERTLTVTADDGFATASDTVDVTVSTCDVVTGCPPTVLLELSPPDSGTLYFIENEMLITMRFGGTEATSPIDYRVLLRRTGEPDRVIATGSEVIFASYTLAIATEPFVPESLIPDGWPSCTTDPRVYTIVVEATNSAGATTTVTRDLTLSCNLI